VTSWRSGDGTGGHVARLRVGRGRKTELKGYSGAFHAGVVTGQPGGGFVALRRRGHGVTEPPRAGARAVVPGTGVIARQVVQPRPRPPGRAAPNTCRARRVDFGGAEFAGGEVDFGGAEFASGDVSFGGARFAGGEVDFSSARFTGGQVRFGGAGFTGGRVDFGNTEFTGGTVDFDDASFTGGRVDFRRPRVWDVPPVLPPWDTPPAGVLLPGPDSAT
jgi:hypothetical protein